MTMGNEIETIIIQEYIKDLNDDILPFLYDDGEEVFEFNDYAELKSYAIWAAYEILNAVSDAPFEPAYKVVDEFMAKMWMFADRAPTEKQNYIFTVASEVARDISLRI